MDTRRILECLTDGPKTSREIADATGVAGRQVRSRLHELKKCGFVEAVGKRQTRFGQTADVLRLTAAGESRVRTRRILEDCKRFDARLREARQAAKAGQQPRG